MMQERRTSLAKVTQPILRDVYRRERVFGILDRARKKPITWISGPPGCGKTVLVTSYLERQGHPCLWYQIDEGDADPATFFYYLGLAAKEAAPRKRKPLPLLTPEYLPGLPTFTLRYFENLYGRLKSPCFFVFDNYQEVSLESSFHEVMRQGLSNIPQGIKVIVVSRAEPPPVFIRLRANNQMSEIAWNELRLTLEESESIVRLQSKTTVSKEAVEHLHAVTDGWLAGLMLMLKAARKERVDPRELGKVPLEQIFDYFAGELFDRIDAEAKDFLLKTAFFPKMTAGMAEALTGFDFASRILSYLYRNHCFTLRHLKSPPTYEYHPLFRNFLLSRAGKTFSPEILAALRRDAAMLLEQANQTEAAIELLGELGDWQSMAQLILQHAPAMLAQGRSRPLEKWLESLPRDMFENNPWLLYWMAACHLPFDASNSQRYFEQSFARFKRQKDAAGVFLAWSGVVDAIFYAWEFRQLDKWFQVLEELMQDLGTFPSKEIEGRVAASMIAALVCRKPQDPEVETWRERALALARENKDIEVQVLTLFHAATHAMFTGGFPKAAPFLESLGELTKSTDISPLGQITARMAEATCHSFSGSDEECLQAVSEGLKLSHRTGVHVMDIIFLGMAASCALEQEDLKTAGTELKKMIPLFDNAAPFEQALYHYLRSREALIRNDLTLASHHAKLASKLVGMAGRDFNIGLCWLREATVLHRLGKYQQAARLQENTLNLARRTESGILESKALFTGAEFAMDQGDETSGLELLRKALASARELQYYFSVDDVPAMTAKLCARALEVGIEVDYVQEIIRKRKLVLDKPPLHLENWPWAVQICTLGRFELVLDGKPFQSSRKTQKKPLEMLKVLTSFGEGQEVTRDQLSDIVWPEAEGDRAQRAFDTTLHRLRQLLGSDETLILRNGRLSLDPRYGWVDSVAFERIIGQAENTAEQGDRGKAIQLLEKATSLYRGSYLGGEPEKPWAISYSERLRSKFLRSIQSLGSYLEEANELDKAAECFERAIEVDDLAEVFYQRLMLCLKQLGRRADALAVYQRCRKTLVASLELEPTPETETIYKSLLSG